ncbi:MAG: type I restriction enzyme HsdR N-terminal domain-containing protein [Bacteroidota bacterium]
MEKLNLPAFDIKVTTSQGKGYVFDPLRKKRVRLTPEEWVRQHFINYLIHHLGYPPSLMKLEASAYLQHNISQRRVDMLIFDNQQGKPLMLVECKATHQPIHAPALRQISHYNTLFKAPFLTLTNGIQHLCYHIHHDSQSYTRLPYIPPFDTLNS